MPIPRILAFIAATLTTLVMAGSAIALPLTYTIRAREILDDGLGTPGDKILEAVMIYEGSTPNMPTMPDQGRFSGGLLGFNIMIDGGAVAFAPVTTEMLTVNAGGGFLFDQFNGSLMTAGTDTFTFTSEYTFGTLGSPDFLPTSIDNTQLLLGAVSLGAGSHPQNWDVLSITVSAPIPEPRAALLFAVGAGVVSMRMRGRQLRRPSA